MKRTFRIAGLCALMALAAVSCKKDVQTLSSIRATLTQPTSDAKTHIGDGNMLMWNAGDSIRVFDTDGNAYLFTTTDNDVASATFTGDEAIDADGSYTAFYPAQAAEKQGDEIRLTLPATQTYAHGTFGNTTYPMTAAYDATDGFNFDSDCGLLALQVKGTGNIGTIELTGKNSEDLAGQLRYSLTGDYQGLSNAQNKVTLNCGNLSLDPANATTFYFVVPAGVFTNGFTAVMKNGDTELYTLETAKSNAIMSNYIMMMPEVTVEAIGVTTDTVYLGDTVTLRGSYIAPTGMVVTEVGFYYGTDPTMMTPAAATLSNPFSRLLIGLPQGTTYYYKAYAKNGTNEYQGELKSFTTPAPSYLIDLSTLTGDYEAKDGDTLINALSSSYKISIAAGATVTLLNADINGSKNWEYEDHAGLTCLGNANIIVAGTNIVCPMGENECGIQAGPAGTTLTISGDGQLTVDCQGFEEGKYGAAIGGGYYKDAVGNIVINSGTIIAKGGYYAAAIGTGEGNTCGTITIAEGVNLTARKSGSYSTYCIGTGNGGTCGTITIGGVVQTGSVLPNQADGVTFVYPVPEVPINETPLTFEATASNIQVKYNRGYEGGTLQYSINGGEWVSASYSITVTLPNVGDRVSFRGNNTSMNPWGPGSYFTSTGSCYVYGNAMSLLYATDFATATAIPSGTGALSNLFFNTNSYSNPNIYNHPDKDLVLPATTLDNSCYNNMFYNCSNLTRAPELPATTLANSCYYSMFSGCSGLTTAPELPATTLASNCYNQMFYNCSGLTTAPELPATTLASSCYEQMFFGCTGLTTAPELPAPALVFSCYAGMFNGCSNLTSITCLATSGINTSSSTSNWVYSVSSNGTFNKASGSSWPAGNNGIPSGWTVVGPAPAGAIDGKFSVSGTQQVWFSQGNLQATTTNYGSTWTWSFASTQYDYIGNAVANNSLNGNGTVSNNGTIDLFAFSSTANFYGIIISTNGTYFNSEFVDWGNNAISNGGNQANIWRTLTSDEWAYLFNSRTTAAGTAPNIGGTADARFAKANLFGTKKGVILFPDNYVHPTGVATPTGINVTNNYMVDNTYSAEDWSKMEQAGAVFLSAAGGRLTTGVVNVGSYGIYRTATPHDGYHPRCMQFFNAEFNPVYDGYDRFNGASVRLVRNVE